MMLDLRGDQKIQSQRRRLLCQIAAGAAAPADPPDDFVRITRIARLYAQFLFHQMQPRIGRRLFCIRHASDVIFDRARLFDLQKYRQGIIDPARGVVQICMHGDHLQSGRKRLPKDGARRLIRRNNGKRRKQNRMMRNHRVHTGLLRSPHGIACQVQVQIQSAAPRIIRADHQTAVVPVLLQRKRGQPVQPVHKLTNGQLHCVPPSVLRS